jgi:hypothetical protein
MLIETQYQSRRQKPYARLFQITGMLFLVGVILACSFSAPTQPVATQPAPTQTPALTQSPSSFNVITIPVGVDPQGTYQDTPYFLETGGGHYLLYQIDSRKLIYDGKEVYSGDLAGLGRDSMALSWNGLHYAYVLLAAEGGNFHDLFIDGFKIATAEYLANPAVTDDGQHYFYTACFSASSFSGSCLFKDGQDVFIHPDGILDFSISRNGDAYLASLRNFDSNNSFVESLALNGIEIYKGHELANGKLLSPNGQHYAYISLDENNLQHLVVDGVDQRSSEALILHQVTDQGSLCTWDSARGQAVINAKEIPVSQEGIQCALTGDASHYVINDGGWTLDGQPIQFPGVGANDWIMRVEWTGQAWNVYRLVK